jgi:hypothetical protein
MVKKHIYKKVGQVKIYLADINGYKIAKNEILIDGNERNRELILLKAIREYNLKINGAKPQELKQAIEPILMKCHRNPLLIPHRLNREFAKIHRREKRKDFVN